MTADFRQQLNDFHAKLTKRAETVVRDVVLELGYTLIYKSPVGRWDEWSPESKDSNPRPPYVPGLFMGSWDYDFDVAPSTRLDTIDFTGGTSFVRINAAKTTPAFVTHYIVNNTEYAEALEYGYAIHNEPFPTPPGGMVRTTALEFRSIVGGVRKGLK